MSLLFHITPVSFLSCVRLHEWPWPLTLTSRCRRPTMGQLIELNAKFELSTIFHVWTAGAWTEQKDRRTDRPSAIRNAVTNWEGRIMIETLQIWSSRDAYSLSYVTQEPQYCRRAVLKIRAFKQWSRDIFLEKNMKQIHMGISADSGNVICNEKTKKRENSQKQFFQ